MGTMPVDDSNFGTGSDGLRVGGVQDHRWSPPLGLVLVAWVGAVGAAAWCVLGAADPAGRLLIGVTAAVLAAAALYGSMARPRLAADRDGIRIGGLTRSRRYPWTAVNDVRLVRTRRFGRDVPTLEIEAGVHPEVEERLLVFGRLELGTDPHDVFDAITWLRPPR